MRKCCFYVIILATPLNKKVYSRLCACVCQPVLVHSDSSSHVGFSFLSQNNHLSHLFSVHLFSLHDKNAQCCECLSLPGVHGTAASLRGVLVLEPGGGPRGVSGHQDLEILLHRGAHCQERPQVSPTCPNIVLIVLVGLHPCLPHLSLLSSDPRQWPVCAVEGEAGIVALHAQRE